MDPVTPMDLATQTGFLFAKEVATQLIALSTGLLTLSVTFTKEISRTPQRMRFLLPLSWLIHIVAIFFGVMTLMALTGTLMPVELASRKLVFAGNVRLPAMIQIFAFVIGTGVLCLYGWFSFRSVSVEAIYRILDTSVVELEIALTEQAKSGWDALHILPAVDNRLVVVLKKRG